MRPVLLLYVFVNGQAIFMGMIGATRGGIMG